MTAVEQMDTVALLTKAADLAERAADNAAGARMVRWFTPAELDLLADPRDARLIAASGPDHWRAVAAMLRAAVEWHGERGSGHDCTKAATSCVWARSLRPLAELVVQQLGEVT